MTILSRLFRKNSGQRLNYNLYQSIDFLPIWNFKKIESTGDFRYLIKDIDYEKLPDVKIDEIIWDRIIDEYSMASNPDMVSDFKNSFISLVAKKREYLFIFGSIKLLCIEKKPDLIEKIRELGYRFDDSTDEKYYNSIVDLSRQLIGLEKIINQKSNQHNDKFLKERQQSESIEDILARFTVYYHTIFDAKKITVREYLSYLKKYNKEINAQIAQNVRRNY
jgi:hypothetical protein